MYTILRRFWRGAKSVVMVRVFAIFENFRMGKKWEDFSGKPCYTGSVEKRGSGIKQVTSYKLQIVGGDVLDAPL